LTLDHVFVGSSRGRVSFRLRKIAAQVSEFPWAFDKAPLAGVSFFWRKRFVSELVDLFSGEVGRALRRFAIALRALRLRVAGCDNQGDFAGGDEFRRSQSSFHQTTDSLWPRGMILLLCSPRIKLTQWSRL
jgi:hypothetical protein